MSNLQSHDSSCVGQPDELPDVHTPATLVLGVNFLPFDLTRAQRLAADLFLQVTFNTCRYTWHTHGVYPFLTESDKQSLAAWHGNNLRFAMWKESDMSESDSLQAIRQFFCARSFLTCLERLVEEVCLFERSLMKWICFWVLASVCGSALHGGMVKYVDALFFNHAA
jgi:hypothetical protein